LKSVDELFLNGLEGMEKPIGKPAFPEALPKVLNGIELGRIWGEEMKSEVWRKFQLRGSVPTRLL